MIVVGGQNNSWNVFCVCTSWSVTIDTNFNCNKKIQAAKKNRILQLVLTIMYIDWYWNNGFNLFILGWSWIIKHRSIRERFFWYYFRQTFILLVEFTSNLRVILHVELETLLLIWFELWNFYDCIRLFNQLFKMKFSGKSSYSLFEPVRFKL